MADFNLGRIKGDKGDRGEIGPKGETGAKGEKGDKGERGTDGVTPVISIDETITLQPNESAHAEIDTSDPASPKITFFIPKGKDGKDAGGDMLSALYDPEGKKQNFYGYADELFSGCLKISGGVIGGTLKVSEAPEEETFVRNTIISDTLPENSGSGDICILTEKKGNKTLSDCADGTVVLVNENGNDIPYILASKVFHGDGIATLVRKNLFPCELCFDYSKRNNYVMSDIDVFLELHYKSMLSEKVSKKLRSVKLKSDVYRRCFLLSSSEMKKMPYFESAESRIAFNDSEVAKTSYFLRDLNNGKDAYGVDSTGSYIMVAKNEEMHFRPAFAISSDVAVENTVYNEEPAVRISEEKCGIYRFADGEWKECASL